MNALHIYKDNIAVNNQKHDFQILKTPNGARKTLIFLSIITGGNK